MKVSIPSNGSWVFRSSSAQYRQFTLQKSQSPRTGHGYSDLANKESTDYSLYFCLNPLERVMGIQIRWQNADKHRQHMSQSPRTGHGYSDIKDYLKTNIAEDCLNPLERVMGIQMVWMYAGIESSTVSQSPRTGHGYSDKPKAAREAKRAASQSSNGSWVFRYHYWRLSALVSVSQS